MSTGTMATQQRQETDRSGSHRLVVNGEAVETAAETLEALLAQSGYGGARVATALNGEFVPAARRGQTRLANGDRVEIVSARQGG